MIRRDWVSQVCVDAFKDFLATKLNLYPELVEKRYNRNYGFYFVAYFNDENIGVLNFGNFGLLKKYTNKGQTLFSDDFNYLDKNQSFMFEYLGFMHSQSKLEGLPRRIEGLTFVEDFKKNNENRVKLNEEILKGEE